MIPEGAAVTLTEGVRCSRCGKTAIPSFNELVNGLKQDGHVFSEVSHTDTVIRPPVYSGMMVLFRKEFQKAIADSLGATSSYSALKEGAPLDKNTYPLTGSDKVSLLTEEDVASFTAQQISGLDFLNDLPDSYTTEDGVSFDLTSYKQRDAGSVLKMTVILQSETYSGSVDEGGSAHIGKISSGYGEKVTTAMENLHEFNEGVLQAEGDVYSDATVTYYFDARTLSPLAAVYHVVTDSDQKINVYQKEEDVGHTAPSGFVKVEIVNTADTYYFFD